MAKEHDIDIAYSIVASATPEQKEELFQWALELQEIQGAEISRRDKIARSVRATTSRKIIFPIIKLLSKNLKSVGKNTKRVLWDDRSVAGRFTIVSTLIATGGLSGQSAGIAALGRAIGVPLWLVIAGGSSLLGTIIQEISASLKCTLTLTLTTEYETIEGRKKPGKEVA